MRARLNLPTRVGRLRVRLGHALWVFPAVSCVAALLLAGWVSNLGYTTTPSLGGLLTTGGAVGARDTVKIIASASLASTTLVFSITVVALQIASAQYSPRLPREFLRDRSTQVVMGVFIFTFAYSISVLRSISAQDEFVPQFAVTLAFLFSLASLAAFVYFIHHIVHAIRVEQIMKDVQTKTVGALEGNHPRREQSDASPSKPEIPDRAVPILVRRSGVIQRFDAAALVGFAERRDIVVRFVRVLGEQVVGETPLAWAWSTDDTTQPPDPEEARPRILEVVQLGGERTLQADVAFGVTQLVDIALRAVSPAVNDPTTACNAIEYLANVMVRLCHHRMGDLLFHDAAGVLRVTIPQRTFHLYLDLACSPIRRVAAHDPAVVTSLLQMLAEIGRASIGDDQREAVRDQLEIVRTAAEQDVRAKTDREAVHLAAEEVERALAGQPPRQP